MNEIKKILNNGIEYLNSESNSVEFIDFEICNNNWIEYQSSKESLSDEDVVKLRKRDKSIGIRDICSTPCYIKFFTRPNITKIEFISKDEFEEVRDTIFELGWITLDLS
jgi:hypothetical protein